LLDINAYNKSPPQMRVAVLQRVLPEYRKSLFVHLASRGDIQMRIFIGEDLPNSKVKSTLNFDSLDVMLLPTRFFKLFRRILLHHKGLIRALQEFKPNVILCEGESNILSYLKALLYRLMNPKVALVHWSLGGMPGESHTNKFTHFLKKSLLSSFDMFLVYSSYGRGRLIQLGCPIDKVKVAFNVSDTERHLELYSKLNLSKEQVRAQLGLLNNFTIIYVGSIDEEKRLTELILSAAKLKNSKIRLILVGSGPLKRALQQFANELELNNVHFIGKLSWSDLTRYYRASDVFVLPGRGGMVISESMAHGIPVVVYQADGTEDDLIRDRSTGICLRNGTADEISSTVLWLKNNPDISKKMGKAAQTLIKEGFSQLKSANAIYDVLLRATLSTEHRNRS
jgi:glycosyltransferase involved in cell wall biosynthesis